MKRTFLIAACALMTTGFAGAQSLATTNTEYSTELSITGPEKEADVKRTPVEVGQLPAEVVEAYAGSQFADWNINEAFKVETRSEEGMEVTYELHVGSTELESTTTVEKEVELENEGEVEIEETTTMEQETTTEETVIVIDENGENVEEKTKEEPNR